MVSINIKKSELLKKHGFEEEELEITKGFKIKSSYPKPDQSYRVIYKKHNESLEDTYFYFLNFVKEQLNYPIFKKVSDLFSASEQSNMFGNSMQKMGINQDKAMNLMATLSKMIKDLFQLVRDIRITDERLKYYEDSKTSATADVALKGIWSDTVDANDKTGQSLFALAQKFDYASLPTFFFNLYVKDRTKIETAVEGIGVDNKVLKSVISRKLYQYLNWKEETYAQLSTFRKFYLKSLLQQYNSIQIYINWLKPYLKNIERMNMQQEFNDKPELVKTFENSMMEVEVLATLPNEKTKLNKCILLSFSYLTTPNMIYTRDYQKLMAHTGQIEINLRGYVWTDEEYEKFLKYKQEENLQLISQIDDSIKDTLDALGDELKGYLDEAEKGILGKEDKLKAKEENNEDKKDSDKNKNKNNLFKPFLEVFLGIFDVIKLLLPGMKSLKNIFKKKSNEVPKNKVDKSSMSKSVRKEVFIAYNVYKKTRGMCNW